MNKTLIQLFEWYLPTDGKWWNTVSAMAPALHDMGFTGVWLPPAYKGQGGIHDTGYGVYDLYDLGEFRQKGAIRTKYGTKAQYLKAISALHNNDLKVFADIVLNQKMGGDQTEDVDAILEDSQNREDDVSEVRKISAWTKFTFPGRKGKYSAFTWDASCFDGTDWDALTKQKGVYRFANKQWDVNVDNEEGNYDYLMGCDLDFDNEKVRQELMNWGVWYTRTAGFDGVRLDALKHIDWSFFEPWLAYVNEQTGKSLAAIGEYWSGDLGKLLYYLDRCNSCMKLFDVPLHFRFLDASGCNGNYNLADIFRYTLVNDRPDSAITFVDNHDTQPGQALYSFIPAWFKPLAYALILFRNTGIPCVFYGDLYGIPHDNIAPVKKLDEMVKMRELYAYGPQHDYLDDPDIIGWTREGDEEHSGMAVIMTDRNGGTKKMYIGKRYANAVFYDAYGNMPAVTVDADGNGVFSVDGGSVSIYLERA